MFLSPGDSHTKETLFLLHMGLEGIAEVNNDSKMRFVSLSLLPLMKEFSVCSPSGYSTREQLSMGCFIEGLQNPLSKPIVDNGLEDLWRTENPDSSKFTCYDRSFVKDPGYMGSILISILI